VESLKQFFNKYFDQESDSFIIPALKHQAKLKECANV